MSDQSNVKKFAADATAGGNTSIGSAAAADQQTSTNLTPQLIDQIREVVTQAMQNVSREQQSQRDKQEARLRSEIQKQISRVEAAIGGQLTPEQRQKIAEETRKDLQPNEPDDQQPAQRQPSQAQAQGQPQPTIYDEIAAELYQEHGVVLNDDDPEVAQVDLSSKVKFQRTLEMALEKKKQRQQQAANQQVVAMAATGPGTPTNLEAQYLADVQANRGKGQEARRQIQEKYRKMGLDVDGIKLTM